LHLPSAAKIVFESGLRLKMVGWDISYTYATFSPAESSRLRQVGTPLARFCVDIQKVLNDFAIKQNYLVGFDLPDPITMAIAFDPAVATLTQPLFVAIETQSCLCRGQTVVDHLGVTRHPPNAEVVLKASRERFLRLLYNAVQ
jgi:purine nucleosidase